MTGTTTQFNKADGVSLKEHLEDKIKSMDEKFGLLNKLNQVAIDKAEDTMNERLAGMNEFRRTIDDILTKLATVEMVEGVKGRVSTLERNESKLEGKASGKALVVVAIGTVLGWITAIVSLVMIFNGG